MTTLKSSCSSAISILEGKAGKQKAITNIKKRQRRWVLDIYKQKNVLPFSSEITCVVSEHNFLNTLVT